MKRPVTLLVTLLAILAGDSFARQGDRLIAERDQKKVSKLFCEYFAARYTQDYKALVKTYEALDKDLQSRAKKAKLDSILASTADMRAVFGGAIDPPRQVKKGVIRDYEGTRQLRGGPFSYHYLLRLPRAYKEDEAYPIVFFLHGEGQDQDAVEDVLERAIDGDLLDQVIVLAPLKPGSEDWMSLEGRQIAFFSLIDTQVQYSFDRLRVFADGVREGAVAAMNFATAYPGFFSGAILRNMVGTPGEAMLGNAQHIPTLLVSPKSGDSASLMSQFADTAKANGIESVELVQCELGEHSEPDADGLARIGQFLTDTKKRVAPEKLQFTTTSLELANVYWLHLLAFQATSEEPVTVKAEIDRATNEITIETPASVSAYRIYVNDALVDMGKAIKVTHKIAGEDGATHLVFEGTKDRSLDRALTLWFDNRSGNLGEVYSNWIDVEVPQP